MLQRVLIIGDVVGRVGCEYLAKTLPKLKQDYHADFCVVNGENSENGNGISPSSADFLLSCGADVITTGNHAFQRKEAPPLFEKYNVLRPLNYPEGCIGHGYTILDFGRYRVAIVNLMGTIQMDPLDNPFQRMDALLEELDTPNIFVDFHAEATSEKKAMGYFLSGKVTALVGTHTHVQTADAEILDQHTAYITDLGMTGPKRSVIGMEVEKVLQRFRFRYSERAHEAMGPCILCGVLIEFDCKTGKSTKIEPINLNE